MPLPSSHTEVVQKLREHQGLLLSMLIFFLIFIYFGCLGSYLRHAGSLVVLRLSCSMARENLVS